MTVTADGIERAQLVRKTGKATTIVVHFNPVSLQYTVANTVENKGSGSSKKQYVTQSTGKLTFDLVFDTTPTGEDVRVHTEKVAKLMEPENKIPPVVSFEWGVYKFQGIVESYKETIDFFAANGVPLRAAVNLTLSSQDKVFEPTDHGRSAKTSGSLSPDAVEVPAAGGPAGVGAQGGDPWAARGIALANGEESLRFSVGASFVVDVSVELSPPVAFAAGGLEVAVSVGFEGGGFGARSSARATVSEGAFRGLRRPAPARRFDRLRLDRLQASAASNGLGTDREAGFLPGGQASLAGAASLRADVNGSARLNARIHLDEE